MILIMPDNMSEERRASMRAFGAQIISVSQADGGMELARDMALQMQSQGKGVVLDQFSNPDNWNAHYESTGPELWRDTNGEITHFVSSMGTTGTIMGVSRYLKEQNPDIEIIGVQPEGESQIPGIRRWPIEYLPKIFDAKRVDRTLDVSQEVAEETMRKLATQEGIFAGVSSGGAMAIALQVAAEQEAKGQKAVIMNVLAFDIETIPDTDGGRKIYELEGLDDSDVATAMFNKRREKVGNEFIATHLQKIVAISAVYRNVQKDQFSVWTLGEESSTEKEIVQNFFDGVDKHTPTLVTWNGSGFDLPVLHYRGLINAVQAPRYWDQGEDDSNFKWNNYISRFHARHTDLMDVIAGYNNRAFAPLDEMAVLLGFPGKMGMSGSKVWDQYKAGEIKAIRDYCETDALNTYLVYLHWQYVKGNLTDLDKKTTGMVVGYYFKQ